MDAGSLPFFVRALTVWVGILLLAVANGALREAVLVPALGPVAGLVMSGAILAALVAGVAWGTIRWMRPASLAQAWCGGAAWLVLTLAFEFAFGLAQGQSLAALLEAYTFRGGNLWPLVLLVTLVAPPLSWRRLHADRR